MLPRVTSFTSKHVKVLFVGGWRVGQARGRRMGRKPRGFRKDTAPPPHLLQRLVD